MAEIPHEHAVEAEAAEADDTPSELSARDADMRAFIGPNADAFLPVWYASKRTTGLQMSDHRRSAGLRRTWPAFFVPTAWLFYRKLWIWGAVSVIAPIVVALVVGPSNTGAAVGVEFFWLYMGKSLVCARGDKVLRGV